MQFSFYVLPYSALRRNISSCRNIGNALKPPNNTQCRLKYRVDKYMLKSETRAYFARIMMPRFVLA